MGFEQARWVWMNGSIVPWNEATLHVSAHTLHYGDGVFEGIRCYDTPLGPAVFRMREHLERLLASAKWFDIELIYGVEQLETAICELIQRNEFRSCYVRPICYRGSQTLHVNPGKCPVEFAILTWPWDPFLKAEGGDGGVRICISPWRKIDSRTVPTTAKTSGQYVNSILAVQDAQRRGYDEALLLDLNDEIAEGSGENIFIVKNGRIMTNDARHSILLGITRESVLEIAKDLGYETEIRALGLDDLYSADEAFFTGTAVEVAAIREVEGRRIGQSVPGLVTKKIQNVYRSAVSGRNLAYSRWLHPVYAASPHEKNS
jgi:branched-chain amino acid aminotransferase